MEVCEGNKSINFLASWWSKVEWFRQYVLVLQIYFMTHIKKCCDLKNQLWR